MKAHNVNQLIPIDYLINCNKCGATFGMIIDGDTVMKKPIIAYCLSCGHPIVNPQLSIDMLDIPDVLDSYAQVCAQRLIDQEF